MAKRPPIKVGSLVIAWLIYRKSGLTSPLGERLTNDLGTG